MRNEAADSEHLTFFVLNLSLHILNGITGFHLYEEKKQFNYLMRDNIVIVSSIYKRVITFSPGLVYT